MTLSKTLVAYRTGIELEKGEIRGIPGAYKKFIERVKNHYIEKYNFAYSRQKTGDILIFFNNNNLECYGNGVIDFHKITKQNCHNYINDDYTGKCKHCEQVKFNWELVRVQKYNTVHCKDVENCLRNYPYPLKWTVGDHQNYRDVEYYIKAIKDENNAYINGVNFKEMINIFIHRVPLIELFKHSMNELIFGQPDYIYSDEFKKYYNNDVRRVRKYYYDKNGLFRDREHLVPILDRKNKGEEALEKAMIDKIHNYIGITLNKNRIVRNIFGLVAVSIIFNNV